jgi:predicted nucleotidyltransferase
MRPDGLPDDVRDLLTARSALDPALDVLSRVPADAGLLLVGSYAGGVAHSRSDVDFVVLLEDTDELDLRHPLRPRERRSTYSRDVLLDVGEIALHLEVVRDGAREALRGPARDMEASALGRDAAIPLLQLLEVRFLIRLRDGVVLGGASRVEEWRADLRVASLPDVLIAINLEAAGHHLENAYRRVVEEQDDLTGTILVRLAAEGIVEAALVACGVLTIDLKQAPRRAAALRADGVALPSVLLDLERVLVPEPARSGRPYLELVHGHLRDLYTFIVDHRDNVATVAPVDRLARRSDARLDWTFAGAGVATDAGVGGRG